MAASRYFTTAASSVPLHHVAGRIRSSLPLTPTDDIRARRDTPVPTQPSSRSFWRRIDGGLLCVLTLPGLVVGLDTSWLFAYATSTAGYIDPWVYFGFFLDLTQHIRTFKGAYFTTRLSWTVPGAIVYHLFPPITATYVLHLGIFYAAILSLYAILKITVSRRAALLATVIMAFHSYFLISVGWPYIDGAGNAYLLLTMASLTYAARKQRNWGWLFGAGLLSAMALYCQFFLIVLSPVVLGYYYFARKHWGFERSTQDWKPFAWGFATVTAALGTFNMAVNGRFFFFANSMGTAAKLMIRHNPYVDTTFGWLRHPTWVILPLLVLIGAIAALRHRDNLPEIPGRDFVLFWLRFYIVVAGILTFFQLIGQPILQQIGYASYLLPGAFLALGALMGIAINGLSQRAYALVFLSVLLLSALPLVAPIDFTVMAVLRQHPMLPSLILGTIAMAAIGSRYTRTADLRDSQRRSIRVPAAVVLFAVAVAALNAATSTRTWDHGDLPNDPPSQRAALLAIVDSSRAVKELDPRGNIYFWYGVDGRLGKVFRAIASTYLWAYRSQSESFPQLGARLPADGRKIVILSEDAEKALTDGQASLAHAGFAARLLARRSIREGPFAWEMIELEVTKNGSLQQATP